MPADRGFSPCIPSTTTWSRPGWKGTRSSRCSTSRSGWTCRWDRISAHFVPTGPRSVSVVWRNVRDVDVRLALLELLASASRELAVAPPYPVQLRLLRLFYVEKRVMRSLQRPDDLVQLELHR